MPENKQNKPKIDYSRKTLNAGTLLAPLPAVMVSCGTMQKANVLTVAWTGIVCTHPAMTYISVRPSRHSYNIIKESGEFVINLTTSKMVRETDFCGVRSGRDMDKMHGSGLTPKYLDKGITFEEAKYTLVCRKLFKQQLAIENIPEEVVDTYYKKDAPHDMYIAEVLEILT